MEFSIMLKYAPLMLQASLMTVYLSILSLLLGLTFGLCGALAKMSSNVILRSISGFYVWIIRSTPLLVQLFIIYFGLPQIGIDLSPFVAGVIGLAVNVGAYNAETIRSGIEAVDKGQHEAAKSIGMNNMQKMKRIILPQAFRIIIPPLGNNFIILIKDTSLVSTITVIELTMRTQQLVGLTYKAFELYILAAIIYAVLTSTVAIALHVIEKRLKSSDR